MAVTPIARGTAFPAQIVTEMFNAVKGHSSIAKMIPAAPIAFNGNTEFVFSMDNKVSVVGENAAKPEGGAKATPVVIRPIKIVYQARVSDEFKYAAEETRLNYLKGFADGFAKRVAEGMDEMILHGLDPATGSASSGVIGNNNLDYVIANYSSGANIVEYDGATDAADAVVDAAIALVEDPTGIILGKTLRGDIAAMAISGARKYPEFAWGATPAELGGMILDTNKTVELGTADALAYVGDWNALRWGFAKEIPLEVIEYGDPDGEGDLKQYNQVMLRSEAYIGWGILDAASFAMVVEGE